MSKATAVAHPIQGLLKYHGLRDSELRLPMHDSISVCTAPFETRTTVELRDDLSADVYEIDGEEATGRPYERALRVVEHIRQQAEYKAHVYMRSENNFQSNIGLGASSSGFAALAMAANAAFGTNLTQRQVSAEARLGAGSAARAVAGGYSYWYAGTDHASSFADMLASAETLPMGMVIAVIPAFKMTEDAHHEASLSPFMPCRIAYAKAAVDEMRDAILQGDFSTVARLAEQDSLSLHATTMTGPAGILHWQPETLQVFHEVRKMRAEGLECYFSVDTGATVYINCPLAEQETVQQRIAALGIVTALAYVGGPARLVDNHLF